MLTSDGKTLINYKIQSTKHNEISLYIYRVEFKANSNTEIWRLLFLIVKLVNYGNKVDGIK